MESSTQAIHRDPPWLAWGAPAAFALVSALAAYGSLRLTRFSGGVSAIWVANGMLVGALLLLPRPRWRAWFVAAFLGQLSARLAVGDAWHLALGVGAANLLESWMVVAWVRRRVEDLRDASSLGRVASDAVGSTLVACASSATIAVFVRGLEVSDQLALIWTLWFIAHVLGMVIVATLVASAGQRSVHLDLRGGERLKFLAGISLMLLVCAATFLQESYPLLFLPFLPLVLLAYRHGLIGMLVGVVLLSATSGLAAATETGPFALMHGTPLAHVLLWQTYVAAGCALAFGTTVSVTQRTQLLRRLARSEAQFVALTENLPAMVARFDREVRYTYANARSRSMLPGVELVGKSLREVRGEQIYARVESYVQGVLRGQPQSFETRRQIDEPDVELHVQFVPDLAADGRVQGFYSLSFDITEAKRNERELERLARYDALTGLANRRHFDESLEAAVARARRTDGALMLMSLDLDHFKQINDNFGHAAGDEVLKVFALRLSESVYNVDLVARQGGDEFHVLVEYSPSSATAALLAGRILEAMRAPMRIGDINLQVGASIGVGLQRPALSGQSLLELADAALYEAKAQGRNTWALREG